MLALPNAGPRRRPGGFTLIELLVVISIIALLISILLPALGAARETAKAMTCSTMVKQLSLATHLYSGDYNDYVMPFSGSTPSASGFSGYWVGALVPPYLNVERQNFTTADVQKKYMTCPNDELAWKASNDKDPSYGYNVEMGRAFRSSTGSLTGPGVGRPVRQQSAFKSASDLILFGDSWHNNEKPTAYGGNRSSGINSSGIHFQYASGFSYNSIFKPYPNLVINGTRHSDSGNVGFLDGHVERPSLAEVKLLSAEPTVVTTAPERQAIWNKNWAAN